MTLAICINCGAEKFGALTSCFRCGFTPEDPEAQAKSIMLSDHYVAAADLRNVGKRIQEGGDIAYDEDELKAWTDELSGRDMKKVEAETARFMLGCFFVIVVVVVGIVWLSFKW